MALTILRTVRPSPTWQDTLISVRQGQRVVFDVEETWSPDMRDQIVWCGADGVYNHTAGEGYLMPGANVGALIARIGDGPVFAVGSRCDTLAGSERHPVPRHERPPRPQLPGRQGGRSGHPLRLVAAGAPLTDAQWTAAVHDRLREVAPGLVPGRPEVAAIHRIAEDVWRLDLSDGGRVVAKHQLQGLLTRGEPHDLVRLEVEVLRHLRGRGCPVPAAFGADPEAQIILLEYAGPRTLAEVLPVEGDPADRRRWLRRIWRGHRVHRERPVGPRVGGPRRPRGFS